MVVEDGDLSCLSGIDQFTFHNKAFYSLKVQNFDYKWSQFDLLLSASAEPPAPSYFFSCGLGKWAENW